MDHYQARRLETQLQGQIFRDLIIEKLLNNGKSAAVFKAATAGGEPVALKIFDNEFLQRYGFDVQQRRINQEIDLRGHGIDGLVGIRDGGYDKIAGTEYFFIIMEFIDGLNIKEYIRDNNYQLPFVKKVADTLYKATGELLARGIAHRDIKPENVMVTSEGKVILMDLGVIKPIGAPSFSDLEQKQFVGTLQYAPPEFLLREEKDTGEAWKAINIYQIGAVLHDLVMKKELFDGVAPFSRLVLAVKEDVPQITTSNYPFETVQLIRDMLTKDPKLRVGLVPDQRLLNWLLATEGAENELELQLEAVRQMTSKHKSEVVAIEEIRRSTEEKKEIRMAIGLQLEAMVDSSIMRLQQTGLFTGFQKAPPFSFYSDHQFADRYYIGNYMYDITGELQDGFVTPLFLLVKCDNDELADGCIDLLGLLLPAQGRPQVGDPLNIFRKINWDRQTGSIVNRLYDANSLVTFNLPAFRIFKGTLGLDQQFENELMLGILKIIKKAIELMADETAAELKLQKQLAGHAGPVKGRAVIPSETRLIDSVD